MFTQRQLEVANWIATGLSNKQIGARLFISDKAVKFHATAIYKILGIQRRGQVVHALNQLNLLVAKDEKAPIKLDEIKDEVEDENDHDRLPAQAAPEGSSR